LTSLPAVIGAFLPEAAAVALSPIPIVVTVAVLGTPRARRNGPLFALGWCIGISAVSTAVLTVIRGATGAGADVSAGVGWGQVGLGVLFLAMAVRQWSKRPRPGEDPVTPGWMASLDDAAPRRILLIGLALSAANPKNLVLVSSGAAAIADAGLTLRGGVVAVAVFVALCSSSVVGAVAFAVVAPRRAAAPLASVKEFMAANNAVIMFVILVVLGAKFLGDGLGVLG
jgi:threonine/homoserine/homoserine lactone efflux protein